MKFLGGAALARNDGYGAASRVMLSGREASQLSDGCLARAVVAAMRFLGALRLLGMT
jgi:hypothetical protein